MRAGMGRLACWIAYQYSPTSSSSDSPSRTAMATSRRVASAPVNSDGSSTWITSKPAACSSALTGIDSSGGRTTTTAGRATGGLLGACWLVGSGGVTSHGRDLDLAVGFAGDLRFEVGHRGDFALEREPGVMPDGEHELAIGARGHRDRPDAADPGEAALE